MSPPGVGQVGFGLWERSPHSVGCVVPLEELALPDDELLDDAPPLLLLGPSAAASPGALVPASGERRVTALSPTQAVHATTAAIAPPTAIHPPRIVGRAYQVPRPEGAASNRFGPVICRRA
jgi:hypothetical protein